MKRSNKLSHKLAAAITAGTVVASAAPAAHAADVTDMTTNVITSVSGLPSLISTLCYIGGIALCVAGIFKIKMHVDNPGQTPLKDGLIRLGSGGLLLALPFLTGVMQTTIEGGAGGTANLDDLKLSGANTFTP